MTNNNNSKQTALKTMVEKLDNRRRDSNGYVTDLPELQAILSELSPLVSVSVVESRSFADSDISVEVKLSFTLERSAL